MTTKRAFPQSIGDTSGWTAAPELGMSLRDFFAAHAMAALILKVPLHDRKGEHGISAPTVDEIHQVRRDIAQSAYDYADAMMERSEDAR